MGLRATQEQEKKKRQQNGGAVPQGYGNTAQEEEKTEETHAVKKRKGRGRGKGDRKEKSKSTRGDRRKSPAQKPKQSPNPRRNDSQGRKASRERSKSPITPKGAESTRKNQHQKRKNSNESVQGPKSSPTSAPTCPDCLTDRGCQKALGGQCPRSWNHPPINGRRLHCGSKGHSMAERKCPRPDKRAQTPGKASSAEGWMSRCSTLRRGGGRYDSHSLPFLSSLLFPGFWGSISCCLPSRRRP